MPLPRSPDALPWFLFGNPDDVAGVDVDFDDGADDWDALGVPIIGSDDCLHIAGGLWAESAIGTNGTIGTIGTARGGV